ncbi:MAG: DUF2752 domain-containing protein [Bacteroidetes bacterium]|nr:DUF2752 domain-containing protein [Bacteroidota bacterium]
MLTLNSQYLIWIDWLEKHTLKCPVEKYFHIECPGCGMQRSIIALLRGNFASSFTLYPALFPLVFLMVYTLLHFFYKFPNGAKFIITLQIITVSTVVVNYIYKIFNHFVFV